MTKLSDLQPDAANANRGTAKGQKAIIGSIQRSKLGRSIVVDKNNKIIGGNKTTEAVAEVLGVDAELLVVETTGDKLIVHKRTDLDLDDPDPNNPARQLAYSDNLTSYFSFELDSEIALADLDAGFDFGAIDVTVPDLSALGVDVGVNGKEPGPPPIDKAAELREKWGTRLGQLWQLGEHRLICGDCTDRAVVDKVMGGEVARMIFTDPPYGIGKDIENDNLKAQKRVDFYRQWTDIALTHVIENAYVYVWGYFDTLSDYWQEVIKPRGDCNFRNFIIWEKNYIQGRNAEDFRQFPENYAAALLFIFGQPFQNGPWSTSPNAEYYPEMFEPLRAYLDGERQKMGWDVPTVKKMVGHSDLLRDHWFNKSQWSMPTREVYETLQANADGRAFGREYDSLRREYDSLRREYDSLRREYDSLRREYDSLRGFFDNTNGFTDVWKFSTLTTTELHPTVKPVEVCECGILTTSQQGEIVLDLFLGSGSTLLACENLGRKCRAVEIDPGYVAVTLERYHTHTGIEPELIETG